MFDCDEMFSSDSDISMPVSPKYDRYQSGDRYHAVLPPYTGTFMPPKLGLVFHDAPNVNETVHIAFNVELSSTKPDKYLSHTHRPSAPIIKDWVSNSKDDSKVDPTQNAPSFIQPTAQVKTPRPSVKPVVNYIPTANPMTDIPKPKSNRNSMNRKACFVYKVTTAISPNNVTIARPAKTIVTKPHSPPRRNINRRPSSKPSNLPQKVTIVKPPMDKGVIDSGCSRHITGNMSYLSNFEAINGGYVAFGGNPNGGKIICKDTECIVLSLEFKLPGENQVLLRVPKENNMYNDLFIDTECIDLTCLFAKATLDESNLWHRRIGHINFKTMNKLVKGKFNGKADEGFLVGYSVSSRGPTWLFDIDTLTKSMNYQPVTAGNQSNPGAGVQEKFDIEKAGEENVQQYVHFPLWSFGSKEHEFEGKKPESEVHVSPTNSTKTKKHDDKTKRWAKVLVIGQISTNNTNTFSAADPSNTVVSLTHGKSLYVDTSHYPDDQNMPALEDITYSDDEEDVGAEADFFNLETTITVSPILATRVHKDHHVTQIIGDLSLATQTRSMTQVVKDQGGLT
nr:hypothetical protein [Tanacetum cinerariifolium]